MKVSFGILIILLGVSLIGVITKSRFFQSLFLGVLGGMITYFLGFSNNSILISIILSFITTYSIIYLMRKNLFHLQKSSLISLVITISIFLILLGCCEFSYERGLTLFKWINEIHPILVFSIIIIISMVLETPVFKIVSPKK